MEVLKAPLGPPPTPDSKPKGEYALDSSDYRPVTMAPLQEFAAIQDELPRLHRTGLLKFLFGPSRPPARPYVDEGVKLTKRLVALFNLSDWQCGMPTYTEQEQRAIAEELLSFQRVANTSGQADGSREVIFHPSIVGTMQRMCGAAALENLNRRGWENLDNYPEDWKVRVSTYLKAWAMLLDPNVLLDLSSLLTDVGYKTEAKATAHIVAAYFPAYAPRFFGGNPEPSLVEGLRTRALEIMQGL